MFIAAKSLQLCPTLCNPRDGSPPGSPVPGILQARTREWGAISFSNAWKWKVKVKSLSRFQLLAIPWTAAYQAPPSMGFARQEYWSGLPLPSLKYMLPIFKTSVSLTGVMKTTSQSSFATGEGKWELPSQQDTIFLFPSRAGQSLQLPAVAPPTDSARTSLP